MDPADFKQYVFPLLFLKRLSDNWNAERANAQADYAPSAVPPEAYADYHRFDIPDGCHWPDLRRATDNVGHALQLILDRIQEANPTSLAGIFGEVAWANKDRLPEHALLRLIDIFNGIPLDPGTVSHDMLGSAYEYLLREFAEVSGKKAGEFFTPRAVVRLLTRLLDPQPGESIYDPACGSAGMLIEAVNEVAEAGGDTRTLRLYGQEVNLTTAAIARMNLFMHDIEDFRVVRGDTLREPKFKDGDGLRRFPAVIANPPFSLKNWGAETWAHDPYGRAFCGLPPAGNGDWAWVQHMLASSASETGGRVGVVVPQGVLFRPQAESAIRQCLLEQDSIEAVIGLGPKLFYSTGLPACLMTLRHSKPNDRRNGVLVIDASRRFTKGRPRNVLSAEDVSAIERAYTDRAPDADTGAEELSTGVRRRFVTTEAIKQAEWNLNLGLYIPGASPAVMDIATAVAQYNDALTIEVAAQAALSALVGDLS